MQQLVSTFIITRGKESGPVHLSEPVKTKSSSKRSGVAVRSNGKLVDSEAG
jgi:hypothetical protein